MLKRSRRRETGNALALALLVTVVFVGLGTSALIRSTANKREYAEQDDRVGSWYTAEAGVSGAAMSLRQGGIGVLGSTGTPVAFGTGGYRTTCVDNGDNTYTITSYGAFRDDVRAIRATLRRTGGLFNHSMFAGNSGGDPAYSMKFGGTGAQADQIGGDVYSGRNITVGGAANMKGLLRAKGTITGRSGTAGYAQPSPDINAMNYALHNDVNVKAEFTASSTYKSNAAGGSAYQVPQSLPSHIFRLNPSDRTALTGTTAKDDYFLEDPYQTVKTDADSDGKDAYPVVLSGSPGAPGTSGNHKIYFIDGNLWINNSNTMSMKLASASAVAGTVVTLVVKGNIYVGDNLFVTNAVTDGVTLIAMKDSAVSDSGNVYFGDPTFGTLEHMQAFMYAENSFFDSNLNAAGSALVTLDGMMSAGNQVAINRDFGAQHSRLTVNYDQRVVTNAISMPGVPFPNSGGGGQIVFTVVSLMEVSAR